QGDVGAGRRGTGGGGPGARPRRGGGARRPDAQGAERVLAYDLLDRPRRVGRAEDRVLRPRRPTAQDPDEFGAAPDRQVSALDGHARRGRHAKPRDGGDRHQSQDQQRAGRRVLHRVLSRAREVTPPAVTRAALGLLIVLLGLWGAGAAAQEPADEPAERSAWRRLREQISIGGSLRAAYW